MNKFQILFLFLTASVALSVASPLVGTGTRPEDDDVFDDLEVQLPTLTDDEELALARLIALRFDRIKNFGRKFGLGVASVAREFGGEVKRDSIEALRRVVHDGRKVGLKFKHLGQEVGKGAKTVGIQIGQEGKQFGLDVAQAAKQVGREFATQGKAIGQEVAKDAKEIGREVAEDAKRFRDTVRYASVVVRNGIIEKAGEVKHVLSEGLKTVATPEFWETARSIALNADWEEYKNWLRARLHSETAKEAIDLVYQYGFPIIKKIVESIHFG